MLREPGPKTLLPDAVVIKRTGELIELDTPEIRAIVVAIAEDFQDPNPNGTSDVVSAAANARITLQVLEAAGLKAVEA